MIFHGKMIFPSNRNGILHPNIVSNASFTFYVQIKFHMCPRLTTIQMSKSLPEETYVPFGSKSLRASRLKRFPIILLAPIASHNPREKPRANMPFSFSDRLTPTILKAKRSDPRSGSSGKPTLGRQHAYRRPGLGNRTQLREKKTGPYRIDLISSSVRLTV